MEKTFQQAVGLADASSKQIASKFDAAGQSIKNAFVGLAAGLTVGAFAAMVRQTIDAVDALNDFADATGSTVENASALEDIAVRTGTSMDTVAAAVVKLNAGLKDSDSDSPVARALKLIGLNAAELRTIDPAEALLQVALALRQFEDDGNKARVVQELFGKSVREVAPLLNDLADKGKLVATVTSEQAKQAEALNKQLFELQKNAEDTKRSILESLVPALNMVFDKFRAAKEAFGTPLGARWFDGNDITNLQQVQGELGKVGEQIKTLTDRRDKNGGYLSIFDRGALSQLQSQQAELQKFETYYKRVLKLTDGSAGGGRGNVNPAAADKPRVGELPDQKAIESARRAAEQAEKTYGDLITKIRERQQIATEELATGAKLTAADQFRAQVIGALDKEASKLNDTQRAQVRAALDTAVAVMRANEAWQQRVKLMETETRAIAQRLQQRDDELQGLRREFEEIGLTVTQLEDLRIARVEDAIARKEQSIAAAELLDADSEAVAMMRQEVAAMRDSLEMRRKILEKNRDLAKDPLKGAEQGIAQYLEEIGRAGDATRDAVKGALGELEDAITQFAMTGKLDIRGLVNTMLAEFIRLNAVRPLMASLLGGGGGGGGAGWLGAAITIGASLFGGGGGGAGTVSGGSGITLDGVSASSGSTSMFSLAGRATGGPVESDTAYLVGEAGPEIAMFRQGGQILPSGITRQLMQGGGGGPPISVQINQQVGEIVTPAQMAEAMEATRQGAIAGVADAMRRGRL